MTPLEVEFLGIRFAVVRAWLTFLGALALGLGVERAMGGRSVMQGLRRKHFARRQEMQKRP